MDLTKWVKLWEKCPELDPDIIRVAGRWVAPVEILGNKTHVPVRNDHAAALIRDKAVLVGGAKFGISLIRTLDGMWQVYWSNAVKPDVLSESTDPTEALYLAFRDLLGVDP